jgi:hypothetical protein
MFRDQCVFKKRKGDCYHQIKQEIRRYEMPKWRGRAINHVHYLRETELCKGRVVKTEIAQVHITGTVIGFYNQYRNVLRHDYFEIAGQTSRHDWYSFR